MTGEFEKKLIESKMSAAHAKGELNSMRIVEGKLQFEKKSFKASFKVHCMAFSAKNEMVALGGKNGELLVKRCSWKTIWKINVAEVEVLGKPSQGKSRLESVEFSPDGRLLAVGTDDGLIHIVDVETGNIKHSCIIGAEPRPSIQRLQWSNYRWEPSSNSTLVERVRDLVNQRREWRNARNDDIPLMIPEEGRRTALEDVAFVNEIYKEDTNHVKADDAQVEKLNGIWVSQVRFDESYRDTILLAIRNDNQISVVVSGVMPVAEIDVAKQCESLGLDPIFVYDAVFSRAVGGISIAVTTCGARPMNDTGQTHGKVKKGEGTAQGVHTHVLNVKFELPSPERIWDLAFRYMRICYSCYLFKISYESAQKNWTNEITMMTHQLNIAPTTLTVGEIFLTSLVAGATDATSEASMQNNIGVEGIQQMRDFLEKVLCPVVQTIHGQLTSSTLTLAFHISRFIEELKTARFVVETKHAVWDILSQPVFSDDVTTTSSSRSASAEKLLLTSGGATTSTPETALQQQLLQMLESSKTRIRQKVAQFGIVASASLQEITLLQRWLMIVPCLSRSQRFNMLVQSRRIDVHQLIKLFVGKFIIYNDRRSEYSSFIFELGKLLEEMERNEDECNFDEQDFFEKAKVDAELTLEEVKKELRALRPEYIDVAGPTMPPPPRRIVVDENAPLQLEPSAQADEQSNVSAFSINEIGAFFAMSLDATTSELQGVRDAIFDDVLPEAKQSAAESRDFGLCRVFAELCVAVVMSPRIVESVLPPDSFQTCWMHCLESSPQHQGFSRMRLIPFYQGVKAYVKPEILDFWSKVTSKPWSDYRNMLHITAVSKDVLHSLAFTPPSPGTSDRKPGVDPALSFTVRLDQQGMAESKVERPSDENVNVNEDVRGPDELRIEIGQDKPDFRQLVELNSVVPLHNGEVVAVAKFTSSDGASMLRMMRKKIDLDEWVVQEETSMAAAEPMEWLEMCGATSNGAYVFDDATRVAIFTMGSADSVVIDEQNKQKKKMKKKPRERKINALPKARRVERKRGKKKSQRGRDEIVVRNSSSRSSSSTAQSDKAVLAVLHSRRSTPSASSSVGVGVSPSPTRRRSSSSSSSSSSVASVVSSASSLMAAEDAMANTQVVESVFLDAPVDDDVVMLDD